MTDLKIKLYNVPNYSHEYKVSELKTETLNDGTVIEDYRLGINKHLILTKTNDNVTDVEFNTGKKSVKLPKTWYEIIYLNHQ